MKIIIRILVVVILLMVIWLGFIIISGQSCIRRIDNTLPATDEAVWEVTTPMKLYYAEKADVKKDGKGVIASVTMTGWYEKVNDKWVKRAAPITLERRIYGIIEVKQRIGEKK